MTTTPKPGRRPLDVGELGSISVERTATGRVSARARTRTAAGELKRLRATANSEAEARAKLAALAREQLAHPGDLSPASTLSEALDRFLEEAAGDVRPQSLRVYRATAAVLRREAGALRLDQVTSRTLRGLLARIESEMSYAAVERSRTVLAGTLNLAAEDEAIPANPLALVRRRPPRKATPTALSVEGVAALRAAIARREARYGSGSVLGRVCDVILGSGLRIGEVLALRVGDVFIVDGRPRVRVTGTIVDDDHGRPMRQEMLKGAGQARVVEISGFAGEALGQGEGDPTAPAIQSARAPGAWVSPRTVRRSMRSLRQDPALIVALEADGLTPAYLTPHLLRRTAATLLAAKSGVVASQLLLGHASTTTTKRAYVAPGDLPVVSGGGVLDELIG